MRSHFEPSPDGEQPRLGPVGRQTDRHLIEVLGNAMSTFYEGVPSDVPTGYIFLLQFLLHDLTWRAPGVLEARPLYGDGPDSPGSQAHFARNRRTLRLGRSAGDPAAEDVVLRRDLPGFDLPRAADPGSTRRRWVATVPDPRSDENAGLGQTHVGLARFHNRVVKRTGGRRAGRFAAARAEVVRHYQWLIRTDVLPRVVTPADVDEAFAKVPAAPAADLSVEGSVAFRFVHSMLLPEFEWNRVWSRHSSRSSGRPMSLTELVGQLSPSEARFPTVLIPDQHRLYDFPAGRAATGRAKRIDTLVFNPYLPRGTTGAHADSRPRGLAEMDLLAGSRRRVPTGQVMAKILGVPALTAEQIATGDRGAALDHVTDEQRAVLLEETPLLFYLLREAELNQGRLGAVGGRLIAREIRNAMARSNPSIVCEPDWRPTLGPDQATFRMTDLLLVAYENKADLLNPLGEEAAP